jgi:hypothetical protein
VEDLGEHGDRFGCSGVEEVAVAEHETWTLGLWHDPEPVKIGDPKAAFGGSGDDPAGVGARGKLRYSASTSRSRNKPSGSG